MNQSTARDLGWDADKFKKFGKMRTGEVLRGQHAAHVKLSNKTLPNYPCIAVYAGKGAFGVGHARIFIALKSPPRSGHGGTMTYYTTDLQGSKDQPAKIYIEEAGEWANAKSSRTWKISQTRAENAVATAKQLARTQGEWTTKQDAPEQAVGSRMDEARKNAFQERLRKLGHVAKPVSGGSKKPQTAAEFAHPDFSNPKEYNKLVAGRDSYHVPVKYGKMGAWKGDKYDSESRYMTCASYAELIMKAAGVDAPFTFGLPQTGLNLVNYNTNVFHWAATMLTGKKWLVA